MEFASAMLVEDCAGPDVASSMKDFFDPAKTPFYNRKDMLAF